MYPALVCSPSLLHPAPRTAVIDMWITACGDGNKSSTQVGYPRPAIIPRWQRLKELLPPSEDANKNDKLTVKELQISHMIFTKKKKKQKKLCFCQILLPLNSFYLFFPLTFLLFFSLTTSRYMKPLIYQGNLETIPFFFGINLKKKKNKGSTQKERRHWQKIRSSG